MATEFKWSIGTLERKLDDGFVVTVHWRASATDGDYSASTYGTVGYTQGEESFVPFDNLTEETVIGWVKESLDAEIVEASLASQIEALESNTTT